LPTGEELRAECTDFSYVKRRYQPFQKHAPIFLFLFIRDCVQRGRHVDDICVKAFLIGGCSERVQINSGDRFSKRKHAFGDKAQLKQACPGLDCHVFGGTASDKLNLHSVPRAWGSSLSTSWQVFMRGETLVRHTRMPSRRHEPTAIPPPSTDCHPATAVNRRHKPSAIAPPPYRRRHTDAAIPTSSTAAAIPATSTATNRFLVSLRERLVLRFLNRGLNSLVLLGLFAAEISLRSSQVIPHKWDKDVLDSGRQRHPAVIDRFCQLAKVKAFRFTR
jgi:hypothetical protein